jgi:DNA-binding response OmpR family regulator
MARRIWIIGAERWPRALLRAELIERGYDAVGFVTVRDAVIKLTLLRSQRPHLIVCDLLEQALEEKIAMALFREGVPVIALAGTLAADDERIRGLPWAAFLRRPITIGAIADAVGRFVTRGALG